MKMESSNYDGIVSSGDFRKFNIAELKLTQDEERRVNNFINYISSVFGSSFEREKKVYPFIQGFSKKDENIIRNIVYYSLFLIKRSVENPRLPDNSYFSATLKGDFIKEKISDLISNIVNTGLSEIGSSDTLQDSFNKIYDYHIRYYNYLYDNLDERRKANSKLKEVYLGRDAIFMYKGRRSYFIGRRGYRSFDNVIYLPFSRQTLNYFHLVNIGEKMFSYIDAISVDRLREKFYSFLKGHRIVIDDPEDMLNYVFVDVGVKGSIPKFIVETIMRDKFGIENVYERDEKYVKNSSLILFCNDTRECSNISIFNPNNPPFGFEDETIIDAVNIIESAPKPTDAYSAKFENVAGRKKSVAELNTPEYITKYNLTRYIIMRHYFFKGVKDRE